MRIEVTQEDIDKGQPMACAFCPIALAIKRATGAFVVEAAPWTSIRYLGAERYIGVRLPPEAYDFIARFDTFKPVEPFSFDLDIPAVKA